MMYSLKMRPWDRLRRALSLASHRTAGGTVSAQPWWQRPALMLPLLLLLHGAVNATVLYRESLLRACDVVHHLYEYSLLLDQLQEMVRHGRWLALFDMQWNPAIPIWPRTIYMSSVLIRVVTGDNNGPLLWINGMLFLTLAVWSTYGLGRRLYGRRVALLAAVLFSLAPGVYGLSRLYGHDLPITGLLTLLFWRLLWLRPDHRLRAYVGVGSLAGLCLLVKLQSIFLMLAPVLAKVAADLRWVRAAPTQRRFPLAHYLVAVTLAVVLSSLYWGGHAAELFSELVSHSVAGEGPNPSAVFPDQPWLYHLFYLRAAGVHLSFPLLAALVASVLLFRRQQWRLVLIYIAPPVLFFSLVVTQKWGRYLLPTIPWVAILVADAALRWRPRPLLRRARAALYAALTVAWLVNTSITPLPGLGWLNGAVASGWFTGGETSYARLPEANNTLELFDRLARHIDARPRANGLRPLVAVVGSFRLWSHDGCSTAGYLLRLHLPPVRIECHQKDGRLAHPAEVDYWVIIDTPQAAGEVRDARNRRTRRFEPTPLERRWMEAAELLDRQPLVPEGGHVLLKRRRLRRGGTVKRLTCAPSMPAGGCLTRQGRTDTLAPSRTSQSQLQPPS